ncbi:nucleoid-associated protein [Caulobacter sp.]|uniref:nucleoid-associated protein n=1 Tax=Caulobacter sp. TaxID=78 RepID=UPI00160E2777
MSDNKIIKAAIHDLKKGTGGFQVTLGNSDLPPSKTAQRVINELYDLYSRRASKSYGKFSLDDANFPTQTHLREYVDSKADFAGLTAKLMENLKYRAGARGAATGGHVLFAHFERDAKQFLLVAIMTDKLGAALTRSFDVTDIEHLDMDGFRFAGRINLTGWLKSEERYIGFLKGRGDVSEYFKEFLGCDLTIQSRKDTSDLVGVLKRFAEDRGLVGAAKDEFLHKAKDICDRSAVKKEEIRFSALANELMPDEPETLLAILTDPDATLNDGFVPDRRALSTLVRIKAKTSLWNLEFERDAITMGKIRFDADRKTLTLVDLPDALTQELSEQVSGPDADTARSI